MDNAKTLETSNPVAGIFDHDRDWFFPSAAACKRLNIARNLLAYCEPRATLALVVKRSVTGPDFALSEAGLIYLETTLAKGALPDGKPVRAVFAVLADTDLKSPHRLKVVSYSSAHETRNSCNGLTPIPGAFGTYWWIAADALIDGDESFI
jgi:hypothetical protein